MEKVAANASILAAVWTGAVCWTICIIYTIFGSWYKSFVGFVLFSIPFLFGASTTYVALRRLDWIPVWSAGWVSLIIFGSSAVIMTSFLIIVVKGSRMIPTFRSFLATATNRR